jgi:hypothetical protein
LVGGMTVSFSSMGEPIISKRPSHQSHVTTEPRVVILIISLPPLCNFEREHRNRCPLVRSCRSRNQNRNFFSSRREQDKKQKLYAKGNGGGREDAPMPGSVSMMSLWRRRICWPSCPIDRSRGEQQERRRVTSRAIRI